MSKIFNSTKTITITVDMYGNATIDTGGLSDIEVYQVMKTFYMAYSKEPGGNFKAEQQKK